MLAILKEHLQILEATVSKDFIYYSLQYYSDSDCDSDNICST